jgi:hypothetical protein
VYGVLVSLHIVFGLFFALTIVCAIRGAGLALLWVTRRRSATSVEHIRVPEPAVAR